MQFLVLKKLLPYAFFLLRHFFVLKNFLGQAYGKFGVFSFEKSAYMGTQPPWFFLQKEASSTFASISYVFFFPAKILEHCIFDSYGVFGTQKTPSICIFRSLMFS